MDFSGESAFKYLTSYAAFGPHPPGTPAHRDVAAWIRRSLEELGWRAEVQAWDVPLSRAPDGWARLQNVLVRIPGRDRSRTTLVGTHWDSRWIADREPDRKRRGDPIPGVNDGGSGTAVQLELARVFREDPPLHDVVLAFFDGEDLGRIDDLPFAVGSRHFVSDPGAFAADRVIALDMVGGTGARFNFEANSVSHHPLGKEIFSALFRIGNRLGLQAFQQPRLRDIQSDHTPFQEAGIPAVLLIDIDYPWWHTHDDTLEHCDVATLDAVGWVLHTWLCREDTA